MSILFEPFEAGADARRHGRRLARLAIDEDVHEMAGRRRFGLALPEEADLVAHRGVAELADPQPGVDDFGERERLVKLAERFDGQADRRAAGDVEAALTDQIFVDHGVEVGIVDDVVDVTVDVVVHPPRRDGEEMLVGGARFGRRHRVRHNMRIWRMAPPAANRSKPAFTSSSGMRSLISLSTGSLPCRYNAMYRGMSRSGTADPM